MAWFHRMFPRACPPTPLLAIPGFPPPSTLAAGETPGPAVVLVPSGWVCEPGLEPRQGAGALHVVDGPACWSAGPECGCEPAEVLPGAILGP